MKASARRTPRLEVPRDSLHSLSPKFSLGQIVATPNALAAIPGDEIQNACPGTSGRLGTLDAEDLNANERALRSGGRLFSSYHSNQNVKF